jgi:hypothetical protein
MDGRAPSHNAGEEENRILRRKDWLNTKYYARKNETSVTCATNTK